MRKGISPIVAVVLLVAISVVSAVGLYFWAGGLATKQITPDTPIAISAYPLDSSAGQLNLLIANLGDSDLLAGTTFYTSNGVAVNLTETIAAGEQGKLTFWGGSDGATTTDFTDPVTVYTPGGGSVNMDPGIPEPTKEGPCVIAEGVGDEISPTLLQATDDKYYAVWASNSSGDYELYIANSTGLCNWGAASQITSDGAVDIRPNMIQAANGSLVVVWQTNRDGNNETYLMQSPDYGLTWSTPMDRSNDPNEDVDPNIIQDVVYGEYFDVSWATDRDTPGSISRIYGTETADADLSNWVWTGSFFPTGGLGDMNIYGFSLFLDSDSDWVGLVYQRPERETLGMCWHGTNTPYGFTFASKNWGNFYDVYSPGSCVYPSTGKGDGIEDEDGRYLVVYDGIRLTPPNNLPENERWSEYIPNLNLELSTDDGETWVYSRITTSMTDKEQYPALLQNDDSAYVLAYSTNSSGNNDIHIRSTTDPLLW